ncbi:unnamed protein product, partial [Rotaria sordida]
MYYQLISRLASLQYHLDGSIINFQIKDDSDVSLISFDETHSYYGYLRDGLIKRGIRSLINTLAWPNGISLEKAIVPNTSDVECLTVYSIAVHVFGTIAFSNDIPLGQARVLIKLRIPRFI